MRPKTLARISILLLLTACGPTPTPTPAAMLPTPTAEPTATPQPTATPSATPTNTPVTPTATPTETPEPTATRLEDALPDTAKFDELLATWIWTDDEGNSWLWDAERQEKINLQRLEAVELSEADRDRHFAGAAFTPVSEFEGRVFTYGNSDARVILTPRIRQRLDQRLAHWGVTGPSYEDVLKALWVEGREWVEVLANVTGDRGDSRLNKWSSLVLVDDAEHKGVAALYGYVRIGDSAFVGTYYRAISSGQVKGERITLLKYDEPGSYYGPYYEHKVGVHGDRIVLYDGLRAAAELIIDGRPGWHEYSRQEIIDGEAELYEGRDVVEAIKKLEAEKLGRDGEWWALENGKSEVVAAIKVGGEGGLSIEHATACLKAWKRITDLDPNLVDLFTRWYGMKAVSGDNTQISYWELDGFKAIATFDNDTIFISMSDVNPEAECIMGILVAESRGIGSRAGKIGEKELLDNSRVRDKGAYLEAWLDKHRGIMTSSEVHASEAIVLAHRQTYGNW